MTATGTKQRAGGRLSWVDRLRGVAIVAMVADHVCLALLVLGVPGPWQVVRLTAGRVAFPLFMLVSGWLAAFRPPSRERTRQVLLVGAACSFVPPLLGLPTGPPDIVLLIGLVLVVWPVLVRWPLLFLAAGAIQAFTWPVPWFGYQPGPVVALMLVGWLWAEAGRPLVGSELGWLPGWVEWCGRRPLALYVGHVFLLATVVGVVSWV